MPICPAAKKSVFVVAATKDAHLFAAVLRPFGPRRQNLTHEIWVRPTYAVWNFIPIC